MIIMKSVLVPVDFSENSASALKYAYQYASIRDMNVDVLHLVPPQTETSDFPMISGHLTQNRVKIDKEVMTTWKKSVLDQVKLKSGDYIPTVHEWTKIGYPVNGIRSFVKENGHRLIICGTRGENIAALDKILGTVSGGLTQNPICPTLFIPSGFEYTPIKTLGYASNLSHSDPYEIWRALKLVKPNEPNTHIFHVTEKSSEKLKQQEQILKDNLYKHNDLIQIIFHEIKSEEIDEGLLQTVKDIHLDILAMNKKKESFIERLFHKSHTKAILKKIDIPLLVLDDE